MPPGRKKKETTSNRINNLKYFVEANDTISSDWIIELSHVTETKKEKKKQITSIKIGSKDNKGMQFDRGYKSPYFVTDNGSMTCQLDEPYILMYDGKISAVKELLPLLEGVSQQNKSLLIVAEDIDGEALAAYDLTIIH